MPAGSARAWTPCAVGLALGAMLACSGPDRAERGSSAAESLPGAPVIIISVDTLRSDRLPIYGYALGRTPAIDALRRDAVLFTSAFSHVPLTLPSHTSLLTGLLPNEHGVRDNFGNRVLKGDFEDLFYLPKALAAAGYETAAVVSSYVLREATGFSQGFQLFDDTIDTDAREGRLQRTAQESVDVAIRWLERERADPFFLLLHLYDPHAPYEAPEPFASALESSYDAEIAYSDAAIGRLVAKLQELDLYDRSLIIFLSDHGEGLLDHGEAEHGIFLYREALQVPLLVKLPGNLQAGATRDQPVGLVDVVPTVLEVLGLEEVLGLSGRSLFSDGPANRQIYAESIYPRTHFGWSELFTLIDARYQYVDAPRPELYDLVNDPAETQNLAATERPTLTAFRRSLSAFDRAIDFSALDDEDDATRQRLAALGYIGTAPTDEGPLADPKDGIGAMEDLRRGFAAHNAGYFEDAIAIFHEVLEAQPRMVDAWEMLGRSLSRHGQRREAVEALEQALELSHGNAKILVEAASLLSELGDYERAREHALLAVPLEGSVHPVLVQIGIREGNLEQARSDLATGYAAGHRPLMLKKVEAELELAAEHWERALALTREVETGLEGVPSTDSLRGLFFVRGRALTQLDRPAEAERAFVREIEVNPRSLAPYTHLALLYAVAGDGSRVGATLKRMVETNPNPLAYVDAVRTLAFIGDQRSAAGVLREGRSKWPENRELRELNPGGRTPAGR